MDQNPQPKEPLSTPPVGSTSAPHVSTPLAPTPGNSTPTKSSNTGLIIGLIVGGVILLLVIVGIVLAVTLGGKKSDSNQRNEGNTSSTSREEPSSNDTLRSANAKVATSLSSFDAVCENGSISNAASYTKPYKVAAFSKNNTTRSFTSMSLPYSSEYTGKYSEHEKVNIVACLEEKPGTAVKSKTCDIKSGDKAVKLDFYALKYTLALHEAKSGKLIKNLEDINAPATSCPMFIFYNKNDPKYYAKPDSAALDAAIKSFVNQ